MWVYLYSEPDWQLFDETIIANSTTWSSGVIASVNWTFIRPSFQFWGGNWNYQKTTENWYDVITTWTLSHWNCHIWISDSTYNTLISNYSYLKIIYDYFNIWAKNTYSYTNELLFWWWNTDLIRRDKNGFTISYTWATIWYNTQYSMAQEIQTSDLSTTAKITNLTTGEEQTFTYIKEFSKESSSSYIINGWWPWLARLKRDQGGWPVSVWNIHIYVA